MDQSEPAPADPRETGRRGDLGEAHAGRFARARARLRQAYQVSRETLRAARRRVEEEPDSGAGEPAQVADQEPEAVEPAPEPALGDEAVPRGLRIAAAWSWRLIVIGLAVYGLIWLAGQYLLVVAPLMIGLLLAGLLMPAQRALLRVGFHRSLAALLVVLGGLAVLGGILALVINRFVSGLDDVVSQVEKGVEELQTWIQGPPFEVTDADLEAAFDEVQNYVDENTGELTGGVLSVVTGTFQFLTGMILALVVTFFFLRDGRRIWDFLVGLLPDRAHAPMLYAGDGAWRSLSGFVRATVLVAFVDAVGIGLGLQILAVVMDFPGALVVPLAALVFLGAFVPIIGAFISGGAAVVVALATGDTLSRGLIQALIVLGIVLLVQQLEGNVLQPLIVSKMVRIHPLAVILAVLVGVLLAGIIGALVAVPLVAVINAVARRLHAYHYHHHRRHEPVGSP